MTVIATFAMKCPNSKSQFYLKRFELELLWYLINFNEMTVIATIAIKCPNSKSQFDPKWFELELLLYLINLQWDECYSNNCHEMSKYEVSFWSKMVWVRASVISDKSSMRWLL